MPEVTISLPSPEDINTQIVRAVAASAIGKALSDEVKRQVEKLSSGYNNPIEKVVEKEIVDIIRTLVGQVYHDKIVEMVKARVTDAAMDSLIQKLWENFERRNC